MQIKSEVILKKGPVTILKERVSLLECQVKELNDKYLRALAELDNYRKRMQAEFEEFKKYAKVDFFCQIIPVLDNFDRALAGAELDRNFEAFYKGMEIIYRQFKEILKSMGLVEFSALGKPFDPEFHEAVGIVTTNEPPENIVVEEIAKGYRVYERVIKPAKVLVSKLNENDQTNSSKSPKGEEKN